MAKRKKQTRHPEFIKAVGKKIRLHREARAWTQQELADRSDLELSQISRIELGKINTSLSQVAFIAKALGVSPSEITDVDIIL